MHDLAEHVGTVIAILGGLVVIIGALIGLIWNDLRKSLNDIKKEAGKFSAWLLKKEDEGGLVTRKLFFKWCVETREKCPVNAIVGWRSRLQDEGGVMSNQGHSLICGPVIKGIKETIDNGFAHNRELVVKDIALMMAEVKIDRATIESIKASVENNGQELCDLRKEFQVVKGNQQAVLQELKMRLP